MKQGVLFIGKVYYKEKIALWPTTQTELSLGSLAGLNTTCTDCPGLIKSLSDLNADANGTLSRNTAAAVGMTEAPEAFAETAYAKLPEKSTGNLTVDQSTYLVEAIAANPDVRWTFLFMHKAPWERAEETNFAVVEEALADRPYTVFNGHVHSYEHIERRGRDYIRLATTGGKQFLNNGRSMDHVTLVTVDDTGVDIANLLMSGVLDKTGHVPLGGDEVCFERVKCTDAGEN